MKSRYRRRSHRPLPTVAIIGAGQVGKVLGRALRLCRPRPGRLRGYRLAGVTNRTLASAKAAVRWMGGGKPEGNLQDTLRNADLVLLAVPDGQLPILATEIARAGSAGFDPAGSQGLRNPKVPLRGKIFLHTSGNLTSRVLEPLRRRGAEIGALHPLRSFARPARSRPAEPARSRSAEPKEALRELPETYFFYEGTRAAERWCRRLARDLRGRAFPLKPEYKILYHAGAVFASNYVVTLVSEAVGLLRQAGIPASCALEGLLTLTRSTVRNLESAGLPRALTGPIARGDVSTVRDHCRSLARLDRELLDLYRTLGRRTLSLGRKKGTLSQKAYRSLREDLQ